VPVRLGRQTVTGVTRADGAKDAKGIPSRTESMFAIPNCSLQPMSTSETIGSTDLVVSMWRLLAPANGPATQLTATSAVRDATGLSYEVDGDPEPWVDHHGRPHHIEVILRRPEG
jgi:hypothetical protein